MVSNCVVNSSREKEFFPNQDVTLLHQVVYEGIRQAKQSANHAHWSFVIATTMSTMSALIGLSGAALLLIGQSSEGSVTTAAGVASSVYSYQLAKEASDRQKRANDRLVQLLLKLQTERP